MANAYLDPDPMQNRRNYYRILHVQHDAPKEIIKASYRTLMQKLKLHPDLGGDEWNAALLNEAFSVLANPKKRAEYDRLHGYLRNDLLRHGDAAGEGSRQKTAKDLHRHHDGLSTEIICPFCNTTNCISRLDLNSVDCTLCRSPLQPAMRLKLGNDYRRAIQRTRHNGPITYFTRWPQRIGYRGIITNLSLNGMHFMASSPISSGCVIKIVNNELSAIARVVNSMRENLSGEYSTGVMFLTLRFHKSHGVFISKDI